MKIEVNFKSLVLLALFTALSSFAIAQRTITGLVTDGANKEALVGASVVVTGTTKGTLTDVDGKYTLTGVDAKAASLTFSFTGYSNLTVPIGTSNVIDAALKGGEVLNELVVVGYGSVKKSDATGAVNVIGEKDFNKGVITSPEQLMQGRVAGVQISANNGEPGGGISVKVRGTSSVFGSSNPLFVIDGVPLSGDNVSGGADINGAGRLPAQNPLNFMNPNDIEKIDILKDASATAIYGSRGANGVVLITTKKGKGKGSLDYNFSYGLGKITKKYDLLGAAAYKAATPAGSDQGGSTDWQEELLRTAKTQEHAVSYGAGDEKGNFRVSLGSMKQEGIVKNNGVDRYTAGINVVRKFIDDKLLIQTTINVSNVKHSGIPNSENSGFNGDIIGSMLKSNPTMAVKKADGTFNQPGVDEPNPAAMLALSKDNTNTLRGVGNISGELSIIDGLKFKTVLGFDKSMSSRKMALAKTLIIYGAKDQGRYYGVERQVNDKLWENYFTYDKAFGSTNVNAVAGYSYQQFTSSGMSTSAADFQTEDLDVMINNLSSAKKVIIQNSSGITDELQSTFGRVNVSIANKYLLTGTVRRDGSTKFGGNNKYGVFPSFAAKWKLLEEGFIPKNLFSELSLRVGYGLTGNQAIPHNLFDPRKRYGGRYFDDGGGVQGGNFESVAFANPDLKWETTKSLSAGIDFGFAGGKITGSLDVYKKNTADLLFYVIAPQPAPTPFVWKNLNTDIQNTGVELALNAFIIDTKEFTWQVNYNVAANKNFVNDLEGLYDTGEINGQGLTGAFAQRLAAGQPLFSFLLRDFQGYDDLGNTKYNGDYQQFLGQSALPKVTGGLTNTFKYKDLDVNLFVSYSFGGYIYNNTANAYFTKGALNNGRNVISSVVALKEGAFNAPDVSTRFLEKGDFIRLANMSLGYSVKPGIAGISNIRFSLTGQNLALWTKYSGQDPEISINKSINGIPSAGIDHTAYPRARTITLGAQVSF
jgi:TonB-dependent starch-binding outer membrane protein SusC